MLILLDTLLYKYKIRTIEMTNQDIISQIEHPIDVMLLIHKAFSADAANVEKYIGNFTEEHTLQSFTLSFNQWAVAMMYHADMEDAHMTVDMEIEYARDNETEHQNIHEGLQGVEELINVNDNKELEFRVRTAILSLSDALHVEVINKLQDVMDVLDEEIGSQALIPRTKRHLFEKVVNARVTQDDHFENEEAFILPIIRDNWSETEQLDLVKILLIDAESDNKRWFIDWMVPYLTDNEKHLLNALETRLT
jgi:hypothetical protein